MDSLVGRHLAGRAALAGAGRRRHPQSQAGAAFLAGTLPYVALGLHAGHVGDHRPPRRVMVIGTAAQTAAALVIPLALAGGVAVEDMPLALIYAAALVVTAGRVFVDAAAFGAIARLVGGGHFVAGPVGAVVRLVAGLPGRPGGGRRADRRWSGSRARCGCRPPASPSPSG